MKAYQVLNAQGAQVWETNNLVAAYNRADRIGGTVKFNYEVNKSAAQFIGMTQDGFALYSGVQL